MDKKTDKALQSLKNKKVVLTKALVSFLVSSMSHFSKIIIIVFILAILVSLTLVAQAQNAIKSSQYKIEGSIELQETSYPQALSLIKKEGQKEEVGGQAKIVDKYLISDIEENEFLDEFSFLRDGFQDLEISIEADQPLFEKESFYYPSSLFEKVKSSFGFETLPEYRLIKEINKSKSVRTDLNLSKISLTANYQTLSETQFPLSIKQTIILTNSSNQDLNLSLLLKNRIGADKIYWNGKEYLVSENPQRFGNPDKVSFYRGDKRLSFYDWSDISEEFLPELWIQKENSQSFLILSLNIFVPAHSSKTIDPTYGVEITILNVHSHPEVGDEWKVSFEATGTANLTITPDDRETIDDIDFISLKCGEEQREPQILEGDVIFYPNWSCDNTGEIIHLVNVARPHILKFQFGDQIAYAYNSPDETTYDFYSCIYSGGSQDCWGYATDTSATPSSPSVSMTEATAGQYSSASTSDNSYWTTSLASSDGDYDSQVYTFTISESTSSITQIDVSWEGYGETESGYTTTLDIWNAVTSAWVNLDNIDFTTTTDQTASGTISSNLHYYIDSNSKLSVLATTKKYGVVLDCSAGDTGWGDNLYGCEGADYRCYDGSCVQCGGWLYDDGCSGCAGQGGDACWYVGNVDTSCSDTCSNGCVAANWNDDTLCTVTQHYSPYTCVSCSKLDVYSSPFFYPLNPDSYCYYRGALGTGCENQTADVRRVCVCNY